MPGNLGHGAYLCGLGAPFWEDVNRAMRIACIHASLAPAFTALGHQCLRLNPPAGLIALTPLLADFTPDLIVQQETLGPRTLIADLPTFSCPKVFWSIDTHLNSFWQLAYARLFDLVCSTQKHWAAWLKAQGISHTLWLPWFGSKRPLAPWNTRTNPLVFVGRITPERPVRAWFVDWLSHHGPLQIYQDLSHEAMLSCYDTSQIVPNEAIFGEVNFRLFEAGSCGCALVTPALGHVEELVVPDKEVLLFRDGAELAVRIRRLLNDPQQARLMGLHLRQRICTDHLPEHRATSLLAALTDISQTARRGHDAEIALWLALEQLWAAERLEISLEALVHAFLHLPLDADVLAALLRIGASKSKEDFLRLAVPVLHKNQHHDALGVNLAGTMSALRHADLTLARAFTLRQMRSQGRPEPESMTSPVSICLAWARELQRHGLDSRPGFVFNPRRHIPQSALECLVVASEYAPQDTEVYQAMHQVLARTPGWEALRLQALSYISLRQRENWRLGLELGMTNCRAFRVQQGLEELALARHTAQTRGELHRFSALLAGMDVSGHVQKALAHHFPLNPKP